MLRALAFGKDQQVPPAINQLAGERKAAAKAALFRHREHVEEKDDADVLQQINQSRKKSGPCWRMPQSAEQFSVLRNRHMRSETGWQRKQNQRVVYHRH